MPAHPIISDTVQDPDLFRQYVDGRQDTLHPYRGRFVIAGGDFENIEGERPGQIVVVRQWPDRASCHAWYASDDYRPWREMRFAAATATVVLVDGLPGA